MNLDFRNNIQPNSENKRENEFCSKEQSSCETKKEVIEVFINIFIILQESVRIIVKNEEETINLYSLKQEGDY